MDEEIEAIAAHLDLLEGLGCLVLVFAEVTDCVHGDRASPLSRRPRLRDREWTRLCDRTTKLADYLAGRGLHLAYHHHMGTVVESPEEIDRLMSSTGASVGLLLDTGHLAYAGGDPAALVARHGSRIVHVHCKDVRPDVLRASLEADHSFLDSVLAGVFTVPGDGSLDFRAVVRALESAGYSGWLVVEAEQDPSKAHPLTYARMGYEYLEAITGAGSANTGAG